MGKSRLLLPVLMATLLLGCDKAASRMEHPEDPSGRYREQISAARRLLMQKETWADRVEWEVARTESGWEVTAWRVEHPERQGAMRYLPWGYSTIRLDSRMVPCHYRRKG